MHGAKGQAHYKKKKRKKKEKKRPRTCSVLPPHIADRNKPSGFSARRHCTIAPCRPTALAVRSNMSCSDG